MEEQVVSGMEEQEEGMEEQEEGMEEQEEYGRGEGRGRAGGELEGGGIIQALLQHPLYFPKRKYNSSMLECWLFSCVDVFR